MSGKLASIVTLAVVCAVGVRSVDAQRPRSNTRAQYSVVASGETFLLVDRRSGQTWLLAHSPAGGTPAWVPIQRIENPEEAETWRNEQQEIAEHRERERHEQQQLEVRERLEQRRQEMLESRKEFEQRARRERWRPERVRERDERDRRETEGDERSERTEESEAPGVREHLERLGQQTHRAMAESLQQHRQRLIEQFGEDHPAVDAINKQIEQLGRNLKKLADDAAQDADSRQKEHLGEPTGDDRGTAFASRLKDALSLLVEELRVLEKYATDHPQVQELRHKIKVLERLLDNVRAKKRPADADRKGDQPPRSDVESDTQKKAESGTKTDAGAAEKNSKQQPEGEKPDSPSDRPPKPPLKKENHADSRFISEQPTEPESTLEAQDESDTPSRTDDADTAEDQ